MQKKIIIFSAPSGSGKTTIVHAILERMKNLSFSISATTRAKRANEEHARDYYFLSVEDFRNKIAENAFVEWEEVYENQMYGSLHSELERIWKQGKTVVFDIDVKGGVNLKRMFGSDALAVFIQAPSIEELKKRLQNRSTETPESLKKRVDKAEEELTYAPQFDKIIINDDLQTAIAEVEKAIIDFIA